MRILYLTFLFLLAVPFKSVPQTYKWSVPLHGKNSSPLMTHIDRDGSVILTGRFIDSLDFDPGQDTLIKRTLGNHWDIYAAKYDSVGKNLWAATAGGTSIDFPNNSIVDDSGNVYTIGRFESSADFDPGPGVFMLHPAMNGQAVFLQKLKSDGSFAWAISLGRSSYSSFISGNGLAVDAGQHVYFSGAFRDTIDFDPGAGIFELINASDPSGEVYIAKLDKNGAFMWARSFSGFQTEENMLIGPDSNLFLYNQNSIVKLDHNGDSLKMWKFVKQQNRTPSIRDMIIAPNGDMLMAGTFRGIVDFNLNPAAPWQILLEPVGQEDAFFMRTDSIGNAIWIKTVKSLATVNGVGICLDEQGNSYLAGNYDLWADLDPGDEYDPVWTHGRDDIFLIKLDTAGNTLWYTHLGGTGDEELLALDYRQHFGIALTGTFWGDTDFDPSPQVAAAYTAGHTSFLVMLDTARLPEDTTGGGTTGIKAGLSLPAFKCYPNPASNVLTIESSAQQEMIGKVSLISMDGKVIYEEEAVDLSLHKIDLRRFSQGPYLLCIDHTAGRDIFRIIKE